MRSGLEPTSLNSDGNAYRGLSQEEDATPADTLPAEQPCGGKAPRFLREGLGF